MTNETEDSGEKIIGVGADGRLVCDQGQGDEGMAEAVIGDGHLIRVRVPADINIPAEIQIWRPNAIGPVRVPLSTLEAEALFQCLLETVG